jgi:hypothetical protein
LQLRVFVVPSVFTLKHQETPEALLKFDIFIIISTASRIHSNFSFSRFLRLQGAVAVGRKKFPSLHVREENFAKELLMSLLGILWLSWNIAGQFRSRCSEHSSGLPQHEIFQNHFLFSNVPPQKKNERIKGKENICSFHPAHLLDNILKIDVSATIFRPSCGL